MTAPSPLSRLTPDHPLVLVGAGKMGGAMLAGWLSRGLAGAAVIVVDPAPPPEMAALIGVKDLRHEPTAPAGTKAGALILAVKPQILEDVLPGVASLVGPETVVLSVVAGKTLARIAHFLGASAAIVRSIPNTPAQVGRGITAAIANAHVGADDHRLVTALLSAVGAVEWVDDEALIDVVTAVSGSGPAYVFHMVEALAAAGAAAGLDLDMALRLARATVEGAGELLFQSPLDAATLRKNVTSPKGTTAEALDVLMAKEGGMTELMTKAVAAAAKRSRELAG
ncbi:MAG: pyrroline-5-carboxylate reductase [Ancalomicrobiaceae bacterium]|nr:pyrroline-5-carboxylate reductase [Ancalomicrobiaceae bacterium]